MGGSMASWNGRAIVVPSPLRIVRRGSFFDRNAIREISLLYSCWTNRLPTVAARKESCVGGRYRGGVAHQKRGTRHDSFDDRGPAVLLRGCVVNDLAHGRLIVVFEA